MENYGVSLRGQKGKERESQQSRIEDNDQKTKLVWCLYIVEFKLFYKHVILEQG